MTLKGPHVHDHLSAADPIVKIAVALQREDVSEVEDREIETSTCHA